ncbi:uncharacterized protein si:dkeyp-55f12.3 [Phycodurus eques]|uniref:uncharacterized protein si:dkeyp-55f12.3 n=1 Tax=Phycodurus eques TaxID=693459 RepID=UPI002ACD4B57|nr:uncharacterized protein si:dkeyp-55f12.3 [Phycodurus eques]
MAASSLSAELKFRDGRADKVEKINVPVENTLTSLMAGLRKVAQSVSPLLNELVEKEKFAGGDVTLDDEDDEEESDGEAEKPPGWDRLQPPAKRSKT